MSPEKEAYFIKKYRKLFGDSCSSPMVTSMCFGIQCEDGWADILDIACEKIQELTKDDPEFRFSCIKEKYARLRVGAFYETDEVSKILEDLEDESATVCERCGSKEEVKLLDYHHYLYTRCKKCWLDMVDDFSKIAYHFD